MSKQSDGEKVRAVKTLEGGSAAEVFCREPVIPRSMFTSGGASMEGWK